MGPVGDFLDNLLNSSGEFQLSTSPGWIFSTENEFTHMTGWKIHDVKDECISYWNNMGGVSFPAIVMLVNSRGVFLADFL